MRTHKFVIKTVLPEHKKIHNFLRSDCITQNFEALLNVHPTERGNTLKNWAISFVFTIHFLFQCGLKIKIHCLKIDVFWRILKNWKSNFHSEWKEKFHSETEKQLAAQCCFRENQRYCCSKSVKPEGKPCRKKEHPQTSKGKIELQRNRTIDFVFMLSSTCI